MELKRIDCSELLRYNLTPKEKEEAIDSLITEMRRGDQLKGEKKAKIKDFDSRIAEADAGVSNLTNKIKAGWELRATACVWEFDQENGTKKLYRKDDPSTPIRTLPIKPDEYRLYFPEPAKDAKKGRQE